MLGRCTHQHFHCSPPLPLQVKRGLEKLYRRVEKDVSEEVLEVVWGDMQHCLMVQCAKFNKLIQDCYPGEGPGS